MKKKCYLLFCLFALFALSLNLKLDFYKNEDEPILADWSETTLEPTLENGYYIVNSAENLAWVSQYVNSGRGKINFKLNQSIDLSGKYWTPIGIEESFPYQGECVGFGNTVKNMTIVSSSHSKNIGLFGNISNATIQNLSLENVAIDVEEMRVGGIVGNVLNDSQIKFCKVIGKIDNSYDKSKYDYYSSTGGIAGRAYQVTDSFFYGDVKGNGRCAGIVGVLEERLYRCFASGTIDGCNDTWVGGVAGIIGNEVILEECCFNGNVQGGEQTAGLIGGAYSTDTGSVINCFAIANVKGGYSAGGICYHRALQTTNCYFYGDVKASYVVDTATTSTNSYRFNSVPSNLPSSFSTDVWSIKTSLNNGFPILKWCYWEFVEALTLNF